MAYGGCFGAVCNYCALRAIRDVIDDEIMRHVEFLFNVQRHTIDHTHANEKLLLGRP